MGRIKFVRVRKFAVIDSIFEGMVRKLKFHEQKLLKKVDFYSWRIDNNLREVRVLRKYHIQKREDYTKCVRLVLSRRGRNTCVGVWRCGDVSNYARHNAVSKREGCVCVCVLRYLTLLCKARWFMHRISTSCICLWIRWRCLLANNFISFALMCVKHHVQVQPTCQCSEIACSQIERAQPERSFQNRQHNKTLGEAVWRKQ